MLFAGFSDRDRLWFECRLALPIKHLSLGGAAFDVSNPSVFGVLLLSPIGAIN
jgi:hypothetical protein